MYFDSRCPDWDLLQAFRLGTTGADDLRQVQDHLIRCSSCRAMLQNPLSTDEITNPIRRSPNGEAFPSATLRTEGASPAIPESPSYPFLLPPVRPDEIGRLGNYRVLRLLGKGGMGFVFHAEDIALRRPVALKVMKPELNRDCCGWERFVREARAMAAIKHESLVTVYHVGQEEAVVYLAMELLKGESLDDWLARAGQPDLSAILRVAREIARGLAAIHQCGLIHRDIKPSNLWMEEPEGRVKILDFGLARFVDDDTMLTQTGTILGTPCFMSPEQARGEPVDVRSDLFSFGCVLYALCTGDSPFHFNNTSAVLTALAVHNPCPVHQLNPAIPHAFSELVSQLLRKACVERPLSAAEVLERLQQIEDGQPEKHVQHRKSRRNRSAKRERTQALRSRKNLTSRRRWLKVILAGSMVASLALAVLWSAWSVFHAGATGASPADGAGAGTVYLSALQPAVKENWPIQPPPGPGMPPIQPIGGVQVQGKEASHGIFMHPPPPWQGSASLTYRLLGEFRTFHAEVSLNDGPPRSETPLTFVVYGDGRLLWKSKPVWSQADIQECAVSVDKIDRLKIEVHCAGEPIAAHAVWIEPCVIR